MDPVSCGHTGLFIRPCRWHDAAGELSTKTGASFRQGALRQDSLRPNGGSQEREALLGGAAQGEPVGQIWLDPFLGAGERHTGMQKERADPAEREEGTR